MRKVFFLFICLFFSVSGLWADRVSSSPAPGTYTENRDILLTAGDGESDIYYSFPGSGDESPVKYRVPVRLSALPGEERSYSLRVLAVDAGYVPSPEDMETAERLQYMIDRKAPGAPVSSVPQGIYYDSISLTFQNHGSPGVYYSVSESGEIGYFRRWRGEPVVLDGVDGKTVKYDVQVFAVDNSGNRSVHNSFTYILDKRQGSDSNLLKVISPVEGKFLNKQLLYIQFAGYDWVKYTLDGSNPVVRGELYSGPVLIDRAGLFTVRVAAYSAARKSVDERTIDLAIDRRPRDILFPYSGVYSSETDISLMDSNRYLLAFNDKNPRLYGTYMTENLKLKPVPDARTRHVLRLAPEGDAGRYVYRYIFIMDGIVPPSPEIIELDSPGKRGERRIALMTGRDNRIFYTLDATDPGPDSIPYSGIFTVSPDSAGSTREVDLKAVSVNRNGIVSDVSGKKIMFPAAGVGVPEIFLDDSNALMVKNGGTGDIIYEISMNKAALPLPGVDSPVWEDNSLPGIPFGMEQSLFLRFASRDGYGNISEPTDIIELHMDRHPPLPPAVSYEEGYLLIETGEEAEIHYSVTSGEKNHTFADSTSLLYTEPVFLTPAESDKIDYTVSAVSVDVNGNISELSGPVTFYLDDRDTIPPVVTGIEDGGLYRKNPRIRFSTHYADQIVVYTFTTDGTIPEDPDYNSPHTDDNSLTIECPDGEMIDVHLAIAPVLPLSGKIGEVIHYRFTIDKKPPVVPYPAGFSEGRIYNHAVRIEISEREDDTDYFYSVGHGNTAPPDCFGSSGRKMNSFVELDVPPGKEDTFSLMLGAEDRAGNRTYNQQFYSFTIDKVGPPVPEVSGMPGDVTNGSVELLFALPAGYRTSGSGKREIKIEYEITDGGDTGFHSPVMAGVYSGPVQLNSVDGKELTYLIRARSVDGAGNRSLFTPVHSVVIDRDPPEETGPPVYRESGDSILYSWPDSGEETIMYALSDGTDPADSDWTEYRNTIVLQRERDSGVEEIRYFTRDRAGNTSGVTRFLLPSLPESRTELPAVRGVKNGDVFSGDVVLTSSESRYTLKYELGCCGLEPEEITRYSPSLDSPVELSALDGERLDFNLRYRVYDNERNVFIGEREEIAFHIDREAPVPPVMKTALKSDNYYQKDLTIELENEEGELFYTVDTYDAFGDKLTDEQFRPYSSPMKLSTRDGSYSTFVIRAYSEDSAGNRSREVSFPGIVIDKQIIYVSRLGNDLYDGTRSNPLRTLPQAIKTARRLGRNVIMLSSGTYAGNDSLVIEEDMSIIGGFDPLTWNPDASGAQTVITADEYFRSGEPLVYLMNGTCTLNNLQLLSNERNPVPLLHDNGKAVLENVSIVEAGTLPEPLLHQRGGELIVRNSTITSGAPGKSVLVYLENNKNARFINTELTGGDNNTGSFTLLKLVNESSAVLEGCVLNPGYGKNLRAIDGSDSALFLTDTEVSGGAASAQSISFLLERCSFEGDSIRVYCSGDSRLFTAFYSENAIISVTDTILDICAESGAVGFSFDSSSVTLNNCTVKGKGTEEFMHLFSGRGGKFTIFNSIITADTGSDFTFCDFDGTSVNITHNTALFTLKSGDSKGIRTRLGRMILTNNILVQDGSQAKGTALSVDPGTTHTIMGNNIYGWQTAMVSGRKKFISSSDVNSGDGMPFDGNLDKNIEEPPYKTFLPTKEESVYKLKQSSLCVNAGVETGGIDAVSLDRDGEARPNPRDGMKPENDIGADEYY